MSRLFIFRTRNNAVLKLRSVKEIQYFVHHNCWVESRKTSMKRCTEIKRRKTWNHLKLIRYLKNLLTVIFESVILLTCIFSKSKFAILLWNTSARHNVLCATASQTARLTTQSCYSRIKILRYLLSGTLLRSGSFRKEKYFYPYREYSDDSRFVQTVALSLGEYPYTAPKILCFWKWNK